VIDLTQSPPPDITQQAQETHLSLAEFEPSATASQRLQTHALDRAAPGIGAFYLISESNITVLRNTDRSSRLRYGLYGPGIESRWGRDFPHPSKPALGTIQPLVQWSQSPFPWGKVAGAWS
jgi:hypothetical protein